MTEGQCAQIRTIYRDASNANLARLPDYEERVRRWHDVLTAVATYVDAMAVSHRFPPILVAQPNHVKGDILSWGWFRGGVFSDGPDHLSERCFWRITYTEVHRYERDAAEAIIAFVTELERRFGSKSVQIKLG